MPQDPQRASSTAPKADPRQQELDLGDEERFFETRTTANIDTRDPDEPDNPELDWGEPIEGAVHGATHSRRAIKTEAERGHGLKTRSRNKEIVSGKPYG